MAGNTGNNATETQRVIYSMLGVSKTINQKQILKDIYLSYFYGAKIGVLGLNGSGKSTLLKILAGVDKEFDGKVEMAPGFRIGYLEQEPLRNEKRSVEEVIREGCAEVTKLLEEYDRLNEKLCDPNLSPDDMEKTLARVGDLQEKLDLIDAWTIDSQLEMAMDALRCPPKEATCDKLSGGERRRVALCRLLLSKPDVLLLDEPTNHLDPESVYWLEQYLARYPGTVIAVTHDRNFLDKVAGWILELDRGIGIPYKGNYTGWLEQKHKRLALEEKQESVRQKTLARELDWVRQNPKGRQAKSKARVSAYEPAPRQPRHRGEAALEGLRRHAPPRECRVLDSAGRDRRHHRSERRRQDHALQDDRRPREARFGQLQGGRHGATCVCRADARLASRGQERVGGDLGR